jgi:pimeloyl-ACP methyl ester carboxylesterase
MEPASRHGATLPRLLCPAGEPQHAPDVPTRSFGRIATIARLGMNLGPWADARTPRNVSRSAIVCGSTRAYVYAPSTVACGVYLVLPGLHFLGPDDPRLDRFCRILAASGFWVVTPFIRSYRRLLLDETAIADGRDAFAAARALAERERLPVPAVFSISFGSRLALDLASRPEPPHTVIVFGGYAEFIPTVEFAITGKTHFDGATHALERDPLNSPVVFLNVMRHLEIEGDRERLAQAWLAMVHRTWGRMELKRPGLRDPIAHEIAASLPQNLRRSFLFGCCLEEGYLPWLGAALERGKSDLAFLDPSEQIENVRCPVVLVHGRDDDVIPYVESIKLSRKLPAARLARLHLTGLYSHTGSAAMTLAGSVRESITLVRMLHDMARA